MQSKAQEHIQPNSFLPQIRLFSRLRLFLAAHPCQSQTQRGRDDANTKSIHGCCVVYICLCFPPASAQTCFCKQLTASLQTYDTQSGGFAKPTAELESVSAYAAHGGQISVTASVCVYNRSRTVLPMRCCLSAFDKEQVSPLRQSVNPSVTLDVLNSLLQCDVWLVSPS